MGRMLLKRQDGTGIQVSKRLAIWGLETLCESLLGGLLLLLLLTSSGPGPESWIKEWLRSVVLTAGLFVWGSGYLLSTAMVGVVWRSKKLWLYPASASVLFLAHLQWTLAQGNGFSPPERLVLRAVGVCIVLACTLTGSLLLRKWSSAGAGPRSPQI